MKLEVTLVMESIFQLAPEVGRVATKNDYGAVLVVRGSVKPPGKRAHLALRDLGPLVVRFVGHVQLVHFARRALGGLGHACTQEGFKREDEEGELPR